jgi:hypothetical protein
MRAASWVTVIGRTGGVHIASNDGGTLLSQPQSGRSTDATARSRNDGLLSHVTSLVHGNLLAVGFDGPSFIPPAFLTYLVD